LRGFKIPREVLLMEKHDSVKIKADGHEISMQTGGDTDYISLTDMAKYDEDDPTRYIDDPNGVIQNWMRSRSTISFLGLWESLYNPNFITEEFEKLKSLAGRPSFTLSPKKWIESTNAVGIRSKAGRGGGTYAHKDIAFEFASWVSPKFKLVLITDYQKLKGDQGSTRQLQWREKDGFSLMASPEVPQLPAAQEISPYSDDDIINLALFGFTEAQWRTINPDKEGSILDNATLSQGLVRGTLILLDRELTERGASTAERIAQLNKAAIEHMELLRIHGKNIQLMDHGVIPTPPNVVPIPTAVQSSHDNIG